MMLGDVSMKNTVYRGVSVIVLAWVGMAVGATSDWSTARAAATTRPSRRPSTRPRRETRSPSRRGRTARPSTSWARPFACTASRGPSPRSSTGPVTRTSCSAATSEGPDTILEGFTITGGNAWDHLNPPAAACSPTARPTVTRCAFTRNGARFGGAIAGRPPSATACSPTTTPAWAAALWRAGTVTDSTFIGNTRRHGRRDQRRRRR